MPLDPGLEVMLDQLAQANGPTTREVGAVQARELYGAMALLNGDVVDVARVEDITIDGTIPARLYASTAGESLPIVVWYHGGGWTIGDLESADRTCRRLAAGTGALVVSLEYRLAPEHRFPAAVDDCLGALRWVMTNADSLGGDRSRVAVGGDSAGGNLAAVIAREARDEGLALRHQLLVYPVTDCTMSSSSYDANGEGYLLTRDTMTWFIENYVGQADHKDPRISPLYADDLRGVAPALIITAEFDPLRDEGEAYGDRLRDAGVDVEVRRFDGQTHSFFELTMITPTAATEAVDLAIARLKTALA
ncbi:MAG: acetyl esterase [Acidimicrobiaceae bacterium]|jgi:acetyl esterase